MTIVFSWRTGFAVAVGAICIIVAFLPDYSSDTEERDISRHWNEIFDMSVRPMSVFLVGGSGEVGKEIIKELAKRQEIQNVTLIGRRELELPKDDTNYTKFTQRTVNFDNLADYADAFKGHDVGICSLGTTRGKSGADGFYKVDHDYVVNSAKLALEGGTKYFNLVSSTGANSNSYFLYHKVKGEVEEEIRKMDFERFSVYRPGLLLCDRTESRFTEKVLQGIFSKVDCWRVLSIETSTVASAIVRNIFTRDVKKFEILENKGIRDLGKAV